MLKELSAQGRVGNIFAHDVARDILKALIYIHNMNIDIVCAIAGTRHVAYLYSTGKEKRGTYNNYTNNCVDVIR